jgi:hypothetical protein
VTSELRSGGFFRLRIHPGGALAWAIPAWATLCGAIASGGLALTLSDGVRLLLVLLMVDAGWGALWGALATTDWATPLYRWREWHVGTNPRLPPYVRPGSPGERLARWLSRLWAWGQAVLIPAAGPGLGAAIAGLALSLILAGALGPDLLALTIGGVALMQLALVMRRGRTQPGPGWDGALRLGLPWLAGHLAFAPSTLPSTALAAAFSVAIVGAGCASRARGRALWAAGQLAAAVFLLPLHRPLAIPFLTLLLIPQLLIPQVSSSIRSGNSHQWARRAWPWLAAGMLVAAWAL